MEALATGAVRLKRVERCGLAVAIGIVELSPATRSVGNSTSIGCLLPHVRRALAGGAGGGRSAGLQPVAARFGEEAHRPAATLSGRPVYYEQSFGRLVMEE